ncbi:MAG: hypothetical protein J1F02_10640 [Lachnospiraceae bacterium]|nr:hypothetical protein [Lachnospiraceae bacterium]
MRTVIVSVIGISSVLLVVMIQSTINTEALRSEEISEALSTAMVQTMSEVMERESYGIENRNEMIAAFLQAMIQKVNSDISLTVKIHQLNYETGTMEVEAQGEFLLPDHKKKRVSVRRRIAFASQG